MNDNLEFCLCIKIAEGFIPANVVNLLINKPVAFKKNHIILTHESLVSVDGGPKQYNKRLNFHHARIFIVGPT